MDAGLRPTRAVLLGLIIACYRIKCFPGLILVTGTIEISACLYVTCWELTLEVNCILDLIVRVQKIGISRGKNLFHGFHGSIIDFTGLAQKQPISRSLDTVKKEGP